MKLLVGYDGSEGAVRALITATALARRSRDVELAVVNVRPAGQSAIEEEQQDALLGTARQIVAQQKTITVTLRRQGAPGRELIETARAVKADLLIVGSRGRGRLTSALLGSVSCQVAATAPTPVMIVPPSVDNPIGGRRVMAAVDESDAAADVIRTALDLSHLLETTTLLAHGLAPLSVPGASTVPHAREELWRIELERGRKLLAELANTHGIPHYAVRLPIAGNDVEAIVQLSIDEHIRLIVVGSRGRRPLRSALLGSFSAALAGRAPCPVVIVPPASRIATQTDLAPIGGFAPRPSRGHVPS